MNELTSESRFGFSDGCDVRASEQESKQISERRGRKEGREGSREEGGGSEWRGMFISWILAARRGLGFVFVV